MIAWLRAAPDTAAPPPAPTVTLSGRALPVALDRRRGARRMTLRLAPDGGAVRITLPPWCPASDAIAFVEARKGWLESQLAKVPPRRDPAAESVLTYRGATLPLDWRPDTPRRPALGPDGRLRVGGPRDSLNPRLLRWLESEALRLFEADARAYCAGLGLPAAPVRLSRARRRWGSCSSEGVLRLNWRLVQAPDGVRRSVVAHEVAHLVHFDHSPAFHALLDTLFEGSVAAANAWLTAHGRTLYSAFD